MAAKRTKGGSVNEAAVPAGAGAAGAEPDVLDALYARIADRAYYLWLERGKPDDGALGIWLSAEAEVLTELASGRRRRGS